MLQLGGQQFPLTFKSVEYPQSWQPADTHCIALFSLHSSSNSSCKDISLSTSMKNIGVEHFFFVNSSVHTVVWSFNNTLKAGSLTLLKNKIYS